MKALIDLLGPLGLLVIAASQIAPTMGRTLPGRPAWYLIGGAVLIVLHLVLRFEEIAKAVGRRQLRYGSNAVLMSIAVLALLLGANYLVSRHSKRWDLTKDKRFGLSDQSRKVASGLKDDVNLVYFLNKDDRAATAEAQDRLKEYSATSPHLKVSYVDPLKDPARARDVDLKSVPTLVVRRGERSEKVSTATLSEQDVTNALIKVTRDTKKKACFVTGAGEHAIDGIDERGFSGLKAALEKNQYEVEALALLTEAQVPERCSVVVLGGPQRDPQPEVLDALRRYVKAGGKSLLMIEPDLKEAFPRYVALLAEWGIEAGPDVVLQVFPRLTAEGIVVKPEERILIQQYLPHEVTRDFPFVVRLWGVRSITPATPPPTGISPETLLQSARSSWAETDLKSLGSPALDEAKDKSGPIPLAVTAKVQVDSGSTGGADGSENTGVNKKEGRVAVFGDSDFATNGNLGWEGNQDFTLNTFAWLSQDADLIAIRPRDPEDQRLFLTAGQERVVYGTALLLLPGLCLLAGLAVWWKRRG